MKDEDSGKIYQVLKNEISSQCIYHYGTISCNTCFESFKIAHQTLYNDIVDYFFPLALRSPKFKSNNYLCLLKTQKTCCRCTKSCRYYGTCCIDAFFNNNNTSIEEYVDIFCNMHKIRRHVKTLPIVNILDISVKFKVERHPMVASGKNIWSVFADHCNKNDSSNDIRVDAHLQKQILCFMSWFSSIHFWISRVSRS